MPSKTDARKTTNGLDIEQVATAGQQSLAAIAHMHSRAFRDAMKFNAEMLDFARRRIGAEIEASERLSRCDTVQGAMEVMTEFCQNAYKDYAAEAGSMMRLGATVGATTAEEAVAEAGKVGNGGSGATR